MKEVNATIITIGDELLIGQTIDTNSAFIAQQLNAVGIWVRRRVAIGDMKQEILDALETESQAADIIIITGGLGPTADDITKPTLCTFFGSTLIENSEARELIITMFNKINRPITERNLSQAMVPDNCTVLQNRRGSAPGMWFDRDGVIFVSLPGVPHEMKGLITHEVVPRLVKRFTLPVVMHRTLLTSGVGESTIADLLMDFEDKLPPYVKLAYLPSFGLVRLRLTGRGDDAVKLQLELDELFETLKGKVAEWKIADSDIPIEEAVNQQLVEKGKTVATAESCTGGFIAHLITSRAGSSRIYKGSVVAYDNAVKTGWLDVQQQTLDRFGAVSEETVTEMALGLLKKMGTDYAIATSGIMGPGGGTDEKPVGTVWIAVANPHAVKAVKHFVRFDRARNIEIAANHALTMLYRFVAEEEGGN